MTIVAVKGGVMAVDSLVCQGDLILGEVFKFKKVPDHLGGGWIAGAGVIEGVVEVINAFCVDGGAVAKLDGRECDFIHLRGDGTVACSEYGEWAEIPSGIFAVGSGSPQAMTAMHLGKDAQCAAEVACALSISCGGTVHVLHADKDIPE